MHAIAVRGLGDRNQRLDVEIGAHGIARCQGGCERARFGGDAGMERERIGGGVHADGLDAQRRRGARDTDGDFASVSNQYTFEQRSTPQRREFFGLGIPLLLT